MINSFEHRCVRDLAWVIASPPLVAGVFERDEHQTQWWTHEMCLREFADCMPALCILDQNPQALIAHLESIKSKRLGLRFEGFIAFWFSSISPNFTLLQRNIQLNEISGDTRSRTIGEIDFIIKEVKSGKLIHLEVAVKFYLGTSAFDDPYRWFGTNTRDQLGKKIDHLQNHQTQLLLRHPEQVDFIIDERHCLLKGRLFYPSTQQPMLKAPEGVTDDHLRGRYYQCDDADFSMNSTTVVVLEKSQWLAELMDADLTDHSSRGAFICEDKAQCYAVIKKNSDKNNRESVETERIFCLPADFTFPD